ncbi:MAG: MFS transporter [Candidatus Rokuibacteriota bacterium]|nr:MAG: MFS transporter [Candidatus Rokubacteria bacterium]
MSQRGLFYGWVVLFAAATVVAFGQGSLFSLGVFLKPLEDSMRWSRSAISVTALINWMAMGAGSLFWGALSDRFGSRPVTVAGGFLLGLGLVLSSQATALWQLHVTFGLGVGFAAGAFLTPLSATATKWFTTNRGLAVAIVSAGGGAGMLLISPLSRWLTSVYDWRVAMIVLGDLAWLVTIPVALLIRSAPGEMGAVALGGAAAAQRDFSARQVLRAPEFWAIAVTHFACCAAHSGPIFHMVTHAIDQGVATMVAATVLGVSGLASIAGRVAGGLIADRYGAKPTLIAGLGLQAAMVFSYLFTRDATSFYAAAVIFGLSYGGVMPLYALVTREYFGEKVMGTAYGAVFLISTIGMGLGAWAGGWIHDALGTYAWLFISSAAIGVMAMVLALTFRQPLVAARAPLAAGVR